MREDFSPLRTCQPCAAAWRYVHQRGSVYPFRNEATIKAMMLPPRYGLFVVGLKAAAILPVDHGLIQGAVPASIILITSFVTSCRKSVCVLVLIYLPLFVYVCRSEERRV